MNARDKMGKRGFALVAVIVTVGVVGCGQDEVGSRGPPAGSKPNIVFVFADDLGYGDLGSYGNEVIATPNLDRMASEGVRFTEFYSAHAVCTPSRAALLTGRYPPRSVGSIVYFPNDFEGLDPDEVTIADLLKGEGYATAVVGKWHLGHLPEFLPMAQGFDQFFGLPYSNDMNAPHYPGEDPPVQPCPALEPDCRPGVPLMDGEAIIEQPAIQETLTQRYTARVIAFMQESVAAEQPFFLYYANNFPHTPLYASEDFLGTSAGGLYGDVVEELDWSVGEILKEIKALGVDQNTLVIFTSDNGPWLLWETDDDVPQGGLDSGTAGPLRQGKGTTFEGGIRVPMIARWPGQIPAGQVQDGAAVMTDWLPTFAALAGATVPEGLEIDGTDIMPVLAGDAPRDSEEGYRYLQYRADGDDIVGAYREGNWKYKTPVEIFEVPYAAEPHGELLFNLAEDIGEENDLSDAMPDRVAEMRRNMIELAAEVR
ncbi:MAG: sulfatase [Deltaproteobacteria bacterium]|nr:sulfatase [Deltaproteobacteria bacterium]NNK07694.1 sulfatase [Myxococcales bacterium]MBT8466958.1 sulfatase [Deltaproteobacteria bacterium]MBT8482383.1 sulfatase [Deltaproteobacteria bacterium]NNK42450.1 sulfatase [Myxococcales bacterium]